MAKKTKRPNDALTSRELRYTPEGFPRDNKLFIKEAEKKLRKAAPRLKALNEWTEWDDSPVT